MLTALFETASKTFFATDPDTLDKLSGLTGKRIALEIKKIDHTFYLMIAADHIALTSENDDVDVRLKAKPSTLLKIARDGIENAELEKGELEIEGDAIIGQRFAGMLNSLDIDWEELIAARIGDVPARIAVDFFDKIRHWQHETKTAMQQNIAEFLVEEAEIISHPSQVDGFVQEVDVLRNDAARLQARLSELEKTLSTQRFE